MTHDRSIDYAGMLKSTPQQVVQQFHQARTRWSLTDSYPMDEILPPIVVGRVQRQEIFYPISDLRLSAGVQFKDLGLAFAAVLRARGHEFRASIAVAGTLGGPARAELQMRPVQQGQTPGTGWVSLGSEEVPDGFAAGKVTNIDFWHHDQHLELWIENRRILSAHYDWNLARRVQQVLGMSIAQALAQDTFVPSAQSGISVSPGVFGSPASYPIPELWFEFSGPVTLHRVAVARDLFYQPVSGSMTGNSFVLSNAAHPKLALKPLGPDQYFVCGDNSPMSSDARAWRNVDKWVAKQIDPTPGVVHKRLIVGKAFFVYFPAVQSREVLGAKIPMVDAGRLRWIW
jgi:hypothetical protein